MENGGNWRRGKVLKNAIRKGISSNERCLAWWWLSGAESRFQFGHYSQLKISSTKQPNDHFDAIEKDLYRTFPDNKRFQRGGDQVLMLREVLRAFAIHSPQIGYCQSLNFIAGLLLIVFDDEERAFWMLVIISEKWLPNVHDHNLEGVTIDQGILLLYLKQRQKSIYELMSRLDNHRSKEVSTHELLYHLPSLLLPTTSWFMSMFIGVMPFETVLRIWDVILYEGPPAIFSVAVHIFRILKADMMVIKERHSNIDICSSELFQLIQNKPKTFDDYDTFIRECFENIHHKSKAKVDISIYSSGLKVLSEGGGLNFTDRDLHAKRDKVIRARKEYKELIERRAQWGMEDEIRSNLLVDISTKEQEMDGIRKLKLFQSEESLTKPGVIGVKYRKWRSKLKRT